MECTMLRSLKTRHLALPPKPKTDSTVITSSLCHRHHHLPRVTMALTPSRPKRSHWQCSSRRRQQLSWFAICRRTSTSSPWWSNLLKEATEGCSTSCTCP